MSPNDLAKAKDPDLRGSLAAIRRAAALARKTAIQTETDLVVAKDGNLQRISPQTLREEAQLRNPPAP